MMSNIKEQLKRLPAVPGVYKFLDKNKVILYIGKAASLKSRVGSYFRGEGKGRLDSRLRGNDRKKDGNDSNVARDSRMQTMISQVHKIETIETDSVLEALILEASLIKKYQPRFNVKLKDDKSFVNIVITDEEYPAAQVGRVVDVSIIKSPQPPFPKGEIRKTVSVKGENNVFGPFPSAKMARDAVEILQKIFKFRTCLSRRSSARSADKNLPKCKCLLYDIGQCSAPCIENISVEEYKQSIKKLTLFLQGKKKSVIKNLEREMAAEAKRENFEQAAGLRNQIFALNHIKDIALIKREDGEIFLKSPQPPFSKGGVGSRRCFKGGDSVPLSKGELKEIAFSKGEEKVPHRIEAYDISNIGGKMAVGSMVVFVDGQAASGEYRKFKIKSVQGVNDAAMMKEVLSRRLRRKEWPYPDLIVVDGGKPQYRAVCEAMSEIKIMLPIIAIAKGPARKKADLIFSANAPLIDLNLIKQLRDESHRFAIKYHRKLRERLKKCQIINYKCQIKSKN